MLKRMICALIAVILIGMTACTPGKTESSSNAQASSDSAEAETAKGVREEVEIGTPDFDLYKFAALEGVPQAAIDALTAQGANIKMITPADLETINSMETPCLILPDKTPIINAAAVEKLKAFTTSSGSIIFLGNSGWKVGSEKLELPVYYATLMYQEQMLTGITSIKPREIEKLKAGEAQLTDCDGYQALGYLLPGSSEPFTLVDAYNENGQMIGPAVGVLANFVGGSAGTSYGLFGITGDSYYGSQQFVDTFVDVCTRFATMYYFRVAKRTQELRVEKTHDYEVTEKMPETRITIKDGQFVYPDGKPFYMVGANYTAPTGGRTGYGLGESVNIDAIETDFKKAADIGINSFRIWSVTPDNDVVIKAVKNFSRKYGIYLLFQLKTPMYYADSKEYVAYLRQMAEVWKDDNMVLGYDLANEPFMTNVGGMSYDGVKNAALSYDLSQINWSSGEKLWAEESAKLDRWPNLPSYLTNAADREKLWYLKIGIENGLKMKYWGDDNSYYAMPGYKGGKLEFSGDYKSTMDMTEKVFKQWIDTACEALRSIDKNHYITVGYNSIIQLFDCNEALDFVSYHNYNQNAPGEYKYFKDCVEAYDRFRIRWPDQPVSGGEMGMSLGKKMSDGKYCDEQTTVMADMSHYFYTFHKKYSGVMIWRLQEVSMQDIRGIPHLFNNPVDYQVDQAWIGLYTYDNSYGGKKKQIANALEFFSMYTKENNPGDGTAFDIKQNGKDAEYVFSGKNALFVAYKSYDSETLKFSSDHLTNVYLYKNADGINLMCTENMAVKVKTEAYGVDRNAAKLNGVGSMKVEGDYVTVNLVRGEIVTIK